MNLIVKPTSSNLWWGVYGLTEKVGWEDLNIFHDNGEKIGRVCLNSRQCLRSELSALKNNQEDKDHATAIQQHLKGNQIDFWYYYDTKGSEGFHEVPYKAPKNEAGIKPRYLEIWHPHESIGIATIESAVKEFAKAFLEINDCQVQIECIEELEDAIKSFEGNEELFNSDNSINIEFSTELIIELSTLWKKPKEDVLRRLKESIS
jgi:hypothetical protein